jgi:hypothetical protein
MQEHLEKRNIFEKPSIKSTSATPSSALTAAACPGNECTGNAAAMSIAADEASKEAKEKSGHADELDTDEAHNEAKAAHDKAHQKHMAAYAAHSKEGSHEEILQNHMAAMAEHKEASNGHAEAAADAAEEVESKRAQVRAVNSELAAKGNPSLADVIEACIAKNIMVTSDEVAVALAAKDEKEETALQASARASEPIECASADGFKSYATEEGTIFYMPGGVSTLTPSQGGRPVTVTLAVDASTAALLEQQRKALDAKNKRPFFSVFHSSDLAAFWPSKFYYAKKLDATGKLAEGVWADGTWTGEGKRNRDEKNIRTFSPTFHVNAIRNDPDNPCRVICQEGAKANMGALENDPAFDRMSPLWAKRAGENRVSAAKQAVQECKAALVAAGANPSVEDLMGVIERTSGMLLTSDEVEKYLHS